MANRKPMVPGPGSNRDRKIRMMRSAKTMVENKHGIGGVLKSPGRTQKPVTLPKMPWDKTNA